MIKDKLTFLDIHAHLNSISESIQEQLASAFSDYGIKLVNFFVNAIVVPETDPSYIRLRNALAKKAEMGVVGYNYQQERTFDVLETAAGNEGAGASIMGAGLGLGMGVNIGNTVGSAMGDAVGNISTDTNSPAKKCVKCGDALPQNAKFCLACGAKQIDVQMILCPKCKAEVPKGKFCLECGYPIGNACVKCGAELPPNSKFCLECGEKVGE